MNTLEQQFTALVESIQTEDMQTSIDRMERATSACKELLVWIDFLKALFPNCCAPELLEGARASMLESVAYIGLGLSRATIGAIRTEIDLLLSFTYFHDHPHEWKQVKATGKGFMLRADILKYHQNNSKFLSIWKMIEEREGIKLEELYKILSAHIHGQSSLTTPKAGNFVELRSSESIFLDSLIELQRQVAIGTSNYLAAVFLSEDISLPLDIGLRIKENLTPQQRKFVFFDGTRK